LERFESVVLNEQPHLVLVVGDVNSTAACALVAKKTCCRGGQDEKPFIPKLAHVEAGLRSFDRTMPEEINRIVTDSVSDYLFTTEESANQNLLHEGIPESRIFFVGNVMIDTLLRHRSKAQESKILQDLQLADGLEVKPYAILTSIDLLTLMTNRFLTCLTLFSTFRGVCPSFFRRIHGH
jgi:UDP-N-acetylglucosamine 2-epimerase (non-hydrolysing)